MVQAALMRTVRAEQLLDGGHLLDLGSERCWALVITMVITPGIATITTVIALGIASIAITASTITAFCLRLCA